MSTIEIGFLCFYQFKLSLIFSRHKNRQEQVPHLFSSLESGVVIGVFEIQEVLPTDFFHLRIKRKIVSPKNCFLGVEKELQSFG